MSRTIQLFLAVLLISLVYSLPVKDGKQDEKRSLLEEKLRELLTASSKFAETSEVSNKQEDDITAADDNVDLTRTVEKQEQNGQSDHNTESHGEKTQHQNGPGKRPGHGGPHHLRQLFARRNMRQGRPNSRGVRPSQARHGNLADGHGNVNRRRLRLGRPHQQQRQQGKRAPNKASREMRGEQLVNKLKSLLGRAETLKRSKTPGNIESAANTQSSSDKEKSSTSSAHFRRLGQLRSRNPQRRRFREHVSHGTQQKRTHTGLHGSRSFLARKRSKQARNARRPNLHRTAQRRSPINSRLRRTKRSPTGNGNNKQLSKRYLTYEYCHYVVYGYYPYYDYNSYYDWSSWSSNYDDYGNYYYDWSSWSSNYDDYGYYYDWSSWSGNYDDYGNYYDWSSWNDWSNWNDWSSWNDYYYNYDNYYDWSSWNDWSNYDWSSWYQDNNENKTNHYDYYFDYYGNYDNYNYDDDYGMCYDMYFSWLDNQDFFDHSCEIPCQEVSGEEEYFECISNKANHIEAALEDVYRESSGESGSIVPVELKSGIHEVLGNGDYPEELLLEIYEAYFQLLFYRAEEASMTHPTTDLSDLRCQFSNLMQAVYDMLYNPNVWKKSMEASAPGTAARLKTSAESNGKEAEIKE